ncbi:class I SAM-dependent methyltransferase [Haloferula rosea]|uniref:Class I SAM-dependent methyltransferase n=1 Tax=Haloferula rosea TaxID=490093 RepID=A0A934RFF1_9BACT|nr:class I SAM-dependent methyltransferase [Haloferula rosea]MBK1828189.1 class I SAM-dependent methyltransferase [Haloferula rosea]
MTLLPRAESAVRAGHPWVFGESIKTQNRDGKAGEFVVMYDRRDRFMAIGLYDPDSPIRVRVVHQGKPATVDRDWWLERAMEARGKREGVVFKAGTNGGRWINGESEGFPGMVVDRYAGTLVVKLYSAIWLPRWDEIEGVLREVFAPDHLVLRLSRNLVKAAGEFGIEEGFRGEPGEEVVVFEENGLSFESAVRHGQKTGFFLDQRDNRARVGEMAEGREVLNLFSFSGGFSLYAARGGASRVVDVDISEHALESARRNMALNPALDGAIHRGVQADVFEWIEDCVEDFDLVIVDPPSLAKRERDREGAVRMYRRLNAAAMARVRSGGVLLAASCSAHVSSSEFFGAVRSEAGRSGRRWNELWTAGHAPDHPAAFAEAEYLKAICLEVE